MKNKIFAIVMALVMLSGVTAGLAEVSYPMEDAPSITYWVQLNSNVSSQSKSLNDTPYAAGLIERTGVQVEYIHPAAGQVGEQFNLMVASGKMPDIVEYNWLSGYTGGPANAIANGLIVSLNDYMDELAPDLKAYLSDPDLDKMVKTDDGQYYGFPMFLLDPEIVTSFGPFLRQDWLDELGLEVPTTIDQWTEVLTAFRDMGVEAPFQMIYNDALSSMFYGDAFIGAYGIAAGMFIQDGKVLYGPAMPEFKEFLTKMNEWYTDGLLDPNFTTNGNTERDANMLNGLAGSSLGWGASSVGALTRSFAEINPDAVLIGAPYPVLNEGDTPEFGHKNFPVLTSGISAVNAKSENIEAAIQFLNYGYTEDGYYYNNFGIEGESYNMVDGYPKIADFIINPAEGSVGQAWAQYARAPYSGPFRQSKDYFIQYINNPTIQACVAEWSATNALDHAIPAITIDVEDSRTYNKIFTEMKDFGFEWAVKAIVGQVSLDEFDGYVATMEDIGLEEALRIQQAAYDRYLTR